MPPRLPGSENIREHQVQKKLPPDADLDRKHSPNTGFSTRLLKTHLAAPNTSGLRRDDRRGVTNSPEVWKTWSSVLRQRIACTTTLNSDPAIGRRGYGAVEPAAQCLASLGRRLHTGPPYRTCPNLYSSLLLVQNFPARPALDCLASPLPGRRLENRAYANSF